MIIEIQFIEVVHLQIMMSTVNGCGKGKILHMIQENSSNWSKDNDKTFKWNVMNDGDVGVMSSRLNLMQGMWRWQAQKLRNGRYSKNEQIKWSIL